MKLSEALLLDAEFWATVGEESSEAYTLLNLAGMNYACDKECIAYCLDDEQACLTANADTETLAWFSLFVAEDVRAIEELEAQEKQGE